MKYANTKEVTGRRSTEGSPQEFLFEGLVEAALNGKQERVHSSNTNLRHRGSKENVIRPEIITSMSGNISPTSNIGLSNYRSVGGNQMQIDTKLVHLVSVPYPRSATSKPHPNVSLDLKRKASANPKHNVLVDMTEASDYNFKENFRVILKDNLKLNPSSKERSFIHVNSSVSNNVQPHSASSLVNHGAISNLKLISKNEELTKQIKKLFIFKKLASSKSPNNVVPTEANEEVRVKVVEKGSKPTIVSSFRLNELITLKKIKTTLNRGALKRMLHAPTFKVYDLQVIPLIFPYK